MQTKEGGPEEVRMMSPNLQFDSLTTKAEAQEAGRAVERACLSVLGGKV